MKSLVMLILCSLFWTACTTDPLGVNHAASTVTTAEMIPADCFRVGSKVCCPTDDGGLDCGSGDPTLSFADLAEYEAAMSRDGILRAHCDRYGCCFDVEGGYCCIDDGLVYCVTNGVSGQAVPETQDPPLDEASAALR